ncbi:MAG: DUF2905 domain-containing protein [Chloroflexi bacterium]|nr:DUF2905 domain-containing protein [Chloroflexota bacterium]
MAAGLPFTLWGKAPFLGRLPGDIIIQRENARFFFPLATSLVLTVLLNLVFRLFC